MPIDTRVEKPTRDLLEKVIGGEHREIARTLEDLGGHRFAECLSLCLRVTGYVVIDVCGHRWPTDSELRRIARRMSEADLGFALAETDAYDFLAHVALGFEPLADVFADEEQAGSVLLLTTASLLVIYRPDGMHWQEYLDMIEGALEEAAALSQAAFPAALLLARRTRALESRGTGL
jgi:hypothetical protein